ncbi:class I adenylate-forming enzyme family protein [Pararhodobacter zhoushanensis]|uniref:AMP-binding protein n=1 Tax=Pararhodobacter zhoushanensis TaxID=2479545 RepID=A0ABT3GW44_9RHOB|nr:AMP-binding protein [Pararhodobacter zhoushanensis]MCW1931757.1 AMP-binding protein [Pararhodobacter zhoushanensis]
MNLAHWLWQQAQAHPGRPALYSGDALLSDYAGLAQRVRQRAGTLAARGVAPGDRVVLWAANDPAYLVSLYALWWLGAVAVPVNAKLHPVEARWIADHAEAGLVLTDRRADWPADWVGDILALNAVDDRSDNAPQRPVRVAPDALAWLFYTSGTTGKPKGVMLSHATLVQMTLCFATDVEPLSADDRMLYAAPMSHGAGLYALAAVRAGAGHVVPESRGFDAGEIMDLAARHGNLVLFAAPTMVKRLVQAAEPRGYRGEGIKSIIYGGGPMYAADIDAALRAFGPRFAQIYGQGECPMTITALPRDLVADTDHPDAARRRVSVGYAQAAVEIAIMDPAGDECAPGETGEICVRGPLVMSGYWRNPQATAQAIRDGWLWTGDLGHLDAGGFLFLTDRSKDVIISGGTNIYPREVEDVLLEHPDLREVSVIGAFDDDWGEVVVACVVAKGPLQAADLDAFCTARMARFKRPKRYLFLPDLPKNAYGKVLKTELRQIAGEAVRG